MWAFLLAVQLRALGEDDYLLTKYDPVTTYVAEEGSYCAGKNIHVLDHPLPQVKQHACVTKCGPGSFCEANAGDPSCVACDGYIKAYDTEEDATDVVCLAEAECQALCTSLTSCHSIDVAVDQMYQKRCYLNTAECAPEVTPEYASDPNYRLAVKTVNVNPAAQGCEMGAGARISLDKTAIRAPARRLKPKKKTPAPTLEPTFSPTPAPTPDPVLLYGDPYSVRGIYDRVSDSVYQKIGGTARVSWHASNCGWVVEESLEARLLRTSDCADADAAAAAAFGLPETDDGSTCASAFYSPVYCCSSALLSALCALRCGLAA
jgi:hypothetical protein